MQRTATDSNLYAMLLITNILSYIKGIFIFKKYSYVILSAIITLFAAISKPFNKKIFDFIKVKLDTEDVLLMGLIAMVVFIAIFIMITIDTFFGLMAAKYEGQKITTSKGLTSTFKMIFYGAWIMLVLVFQVIAYASEKDTMLFIMNYVMFFSSALIVLWEVRSIGNNLERRFKKEYAFFTLIDKVIDILEKKVGVFLENTICKTQDNSEIKENED